MGLSDTRRSYNRGCDEVRLPAKAVRPAVSPAVGPVDRRRSIPYGCSQDAGEPPGRQDTPPLWSAESTPAATLATLKTTSPERFFGRHAYNFPTILPSKQCC